MNLITEETSHLRLVCQVDSPFEEHLFDELLIIIVSLQRLFVKLIEIGRVSRDVEVVNMVMKLLAPQKARRLAHGHLARQSIVLDRSIVHATVSIRAEQVVCVFVTTNASLVKLVVTLGARLEATCLDIEAILGVLSVAAICALLHDVLHLLHLDVCLCHLEMDLLLHFVGLLHAFFNLTVVVTIVDIIDRVVLQ